MRRRKLSLAIGCGSGLLVLTTSARADEDFNPAPDAARHPDLTYAVRGGVPLKLDLFTPAGPGPWPTVLWFHGGAWMFGDRTGWPHMMFLLAHGYAVANVDYRLSQAAPFPAQLDDCQAALDFLCGHAAQYGLDPARMAATGESAGGHLAALLGLTRGPATAAAAGRVRAVVDLFGPTDLPALAARSPELTKAVHQLLGGTPADRPDLYRAASPLDRVSAGDPPFLVLHGDRDAVVPIAQSERFVAALRAAHVPVRFEVVAGAGHAQPAFWAPAYRKVILDFLDHAVSAH